VYKAFAVLMVSGLIFFGKAAMAIALSNSDIALEVVEPISDRLILPDTEVVSRQERQEIRISACRGEFEPASFIIRSLGRDMLGLTIEASDLRNANSLLRKMNVDIRVVKVWYQGGSAWVGIRADGERRLVPELLLKDDKLIMVDYEKGENYARLKFQDGVRYELISGKSKIHNGRVVLSTEEFPIEDSCELRPIDLYTNKTKQIWITVRVPINTRPGYYRGSIFIKKQSKIIHEIPIVIEVLSFNLVHPTMEYSIYYRGQLSKKPTISSEKKSEEQLTAELKNMKEHGVDNPVVYQRFQNKERLRRYLSIRQSLGMVGQPLYYIGIRTEHPEGFRSIIGYVRKTKEMFALARQYGATDLYVYGIDEASQEMVEKQKRAWNAIQRTGTKIFAAGWRKDDFKYLEDSVDLFVDGSRTSAIKSKRFHQLGKRIFSYNRPQAGIENPFIYRKNYGLNLWRAEYDGAMIYAYQDGFGTIWNDFDHYRFRDHCFTYPTKKGIIDTIAWEGLREGIDDVKYINTLQKRIGEIKRKNKNALLEQAQNAQRFLGQLKQSIGIKPAQARKIIIAHLKALSTN